MALSEITVRGAREHNLKNVDVRIPRDRLVVITGLSGSGKSSLAFDTLYAEGQRRYVESLSSYARQFLGQMKKPEVEHVEGLSPAISIDQKTVHRNPRSTVGTVTEIYDYLRLLFAHVGTPHCPQCGEEVSKQSPQEICKQVLQLPEGTKAQVLAPIVRGRKGTYQKEFKDLRAKGYARARVNGEVVALEDPPSLKRYEKHTIEAVVDRIVVKPSAKSRIQDSLEEALKESGGLVVVEVPAVGKKKAKEYMFSENFACAACGVNLPEIVPRIFSFNSPHGACEDCSGLGFRLQVDEDKIVVDPEARMMSAFHPSVHRINAWSLKWLRSLAKEVGVDLKKPFKRLPKGFREVVLYGTEFEGGSPTRDRYSGGWEFEGLIPRMERLYHESDSPRMKMRIESFQREIPCKRCKGERLRPGVLAVRIDDKNIMDVTRMHIAGAVEWFETLPGRLGAYKARIAEEVIKEIRARLGFLKDVGLGYLSLSRASGTLSGGEAQRIRLATQIGSGLVGVLYILDEPSIGLHQRDNKRLLATLMHLRDQGNTVIVVEHDEETMWSADHLIDLGPGAGALGGKLIAQGTPQEVAATEGSVTGAYLSGRMEIATPDKRRSGSGKRLVIKGAQANNLKKIDVGFPLGKLVCVTGVSGSGKSTLVNEVLVKGSKMRLSKSGEVPGEHKEIRGLDHVDKIIEIDQNPIGRTPRSNPATYTGLFTPIRELFAATAQARQRGYRPGRFSFNVKGGRCEACTGDGIVTIEMHFLPDVHVPCEVCKGARYQEETLEVTYKGKNIRQVLDMSVDEAMKFYEPVPAIHRKLKTLHDVGLGYIRLGQPATTLSGGEAQRVKLATELSKRSTGRTLYVLDEPTTGMHAHDMTYLLKVLNRLADGGNTVVVIEHNLDVIKTADHVIDLGPEGGDEGGYVVAEGTPEEVAKTDTWTGKYLHEILEKATLVDDAVKKGKRAHLEMPVVG